MEKVIERSEIYDECIRCGELTDEPINKHIDFRRNYVEGAGQLCEKCHSEVYDRK